MSPQNFLSKAQPESAQTKPIPHSLKNVRQDTLNTGGVGQPQVVPPIKSRTLHLPYTDANHFKAPILVKTLLEANSTLTETMDNLLAWTGLEKQPLNTSSPVIPVCGNPIIATGLACSLLHHHTPSHPHQKVAILEWGQPQGNLLKLLDTNAPTTGLNELFQSQADLTHLVLNAKVHRFMPQLYAIGQGEGTVKAIEELPKLSQLMAALSKKFHRIVLSLPSYEQDPRVPEMLARLGMNYALFYDPDDTVMRKLPTVRMIWRNGTIQRLT